MLWSLVYNIPRYLILQPASYWEPALNRTWVRLEPSPLSRSHVLLSIYFGYANTALKVVLPVVLVSVLNIVLLCYLRRRRHYLLQQVRTSHHNGHAHYTARTSRGWAGGRGRVGGGSAANLVPGGSGGGGAGGVGPASHQRVTTVVLAITGFFLVSQVFAGAQVLLHLLKVDRSHPQAASVFAQVGGRLVCVWV